MRCTSNTCLNGPTKLIRALYLHMQRVSDLCLYGTLYHNKMQQSSVLKKGFKKCLFKPLSWRLIKVSHNLQCTVSYSTVVHGALTAFCPPPLLLSGGHIFAKAIPHPPLVSPEQTLKAMGKKEEGLTEEGVILSRFFLHFFCLSLFSARSQSCRSVCPCAFSLHDYLLPLR